MNLVVVCHDGFFLLSDKEEEEDRNHPENDSKKWFEGGKTNTEYEADIYIPLEMKEGEYEYEYGVIVEDTEDIYSVPTHSPRKKSEEENTYYNLDPSPAPSPSPHKKKSVS